MRVRVHSHLMTPSLEPATAPGSRDPPSAFCTGRSRTNSDDGDDSEGAIRQLRSALHAASKVMRVLTP